MAMPDELRPQTAPPPAPRLPCAITGKPARYRDPATGLPYADLEAYRELQRRREAGQYQVLAALPSLPGAGLLAQQQQAGFQQTLPLGLADQQGAMQLQHSTQVAAPQAAVPDVWQQQQGALAQQGHYQPAALLQQQPPAFDPGQLLGPPLVADLAQQPAAFFPPMPTPAAAAGGYT
jgi:vacuolar protein sorting-associated protein 72